MMDPEEGFGFEHMISTAALMQNLRTSALNVDNGKDLFRGDALLRGRLMRCVGLRDDLGLFLRGRVAVNAVVKDTHSLTSTWPSDGRPI